MNLVKAAIGTAAVITCCLGNEMPANAFSVRCTENFGTTRCTDSNLDTTTIRKGYGGSTTITGPDGTMTRCYTNFGTTTCY